MKKIREPVLIDEAVTLLGKTNCQTKIDGKWYIAKPLPYYGWHNILLRIYHAWLVLTGKASAWQYMEDRKTTNPNQHP